MALIPTTDEHTKALFWSDEVYPMTSPRGRVLLFNIDEFDNPANNRAGAAKDRDELEKLFKDLDFIVQIHNSPSAEMLLDLIERETHNEDHQKYGIFVLIVMSHGIKDAVRGRDGKLVEYSNIISRLNNSSFPAMAKKPKWIIFQACSGDAEDIAIRSDKAEERRSAGLESVMFQPRSGVHTDTSDIIILQAAFPGYKSWRNPKEGSYLVQSFVRMIRQHAHNKSIHQLIVKIRKDVMELLALAQTGATNRSQTVFSSESLMNALYLFPGLGDRTTPRLKHMKTIPSRSWCYSVTFDSKQNVVHAGFGYDSNNRRRESTKIACIRADPDNRIIQLEIDDKGKVSHLVAYQLEPPTSFFEWILRMIRNMTLDPPCLYYIHKIRVQDAYSSYYSDHFTKIGDTLIVTGGESGRVYFYKYSTGESIREVTHPDMKHPCGICHDTDSSIYVTDFWSGYIFNITWRDDGSPTVTKFNCGIAQPAAIAFHNGRLVVLSDVYSAHKLHILTTKGKTVKVYDLPECNGSFVLDVSISSEGLVAIANFKQGVQLYQLD